MKTFLNLGSGHDHAAWTSGDLRLAVDVNTSLPLPDSRIEVGP